MTGKTEEVRRYVENRLFEMQDKDYGDFHSRLMPNIERERIIGVRTPQLRRFAKEFVKNPEKEMFMEDLPHKYYEENNLHGFLIEAMGDFDNAVKYLERFLPYIDNWATCDMTSPKVFKKHTDKLLPCINKWIRSDKTYTIRYGIGMLMKHYLDGEFKTEYLSRVVGIKSEEYYVNMMIAWYFATALDKQYDSAVEYIEQKRLSLWVHNKTIQKAIESRRIPKDKKDYLKTLKIK